MPRTALFRFWKAIVIGLTVLLFAMAVVTRPAPEWTAALVFGALVFVASFLRIGTGDASIGFEAAIVFGAIVIYHSPSVALVAALLGAGLHALYEAVRERSRSIEPFYNAAQLAFSYYIVGLLYSVAVARDA